MRAALLSILIVCACGGSSAEQRPPARERQFAPYADCAGPKAYKCGHVRARGGQVARMPEPEQTATALPDAVEAGPTVYKVVLENEQVRVLLADYAPDSKVPPHRHTDHVLFELTSGAAVFQPSGTHEVDGAGPTTMRAILVELGVKPGSAVPAGDEPVAKHPRTFKLLVDGARTRVLAVTFGKGTSRPVALGDHVLVSRDKGTLIVTRVSGQARTLALEPGKVELFPAGVYTATNPKKESFDITIIELKAP